MIYFFNGILFSMIKRNERLSYEYFKCILLNESSYFIKDIYYDFNYIKFYKW